MYMVHAGSLALKSFRVSPNLVSISHAYRRPVPIKLMKYEMAQNFDLACQTVIKN
jgi:hypothetical protein